MVQGEVLAARARVPLVPALLGMAMHQFHRANGDESLNDGEMKTATITITDANGATVGSDDTVIVTVRGSTSVPALPLVAQLLLALLLLAGGARLYRRHPGGCALPSSWWTAWVR